MIKILHIVSTINKGSGVMNAIMNYFRYINKTEICFDFLFFQKSDDNFSEEITELGGSIFYFSKPDIKGYLSAKKELDTFFKNTASCYSIIHSHEIIVSKMLFKFARKYSDNILCISHIHSSKYSNSFIKSFRNRILAKGFVKKSDYVCACSQTAARAISGKRLLKSDKLKIVYNAIDIEKFKFSDDHRKRIREQNGLEGFIVLGHSGRFSKEKNQAFLVELIKRLDKQKYKLLLLGDGPNYKKIKDLALICEDNVVFTGNVQSVSQYLNAMDIFLFPSKFEGLGISCIEAQASGLPTLVSDKLPPEVNLSGSVEFIPIKSFDDWIVGINSALASIHQERENLNQLFCGSTYDISIQAQELSEFYILILKENIK